MRKFSPILLGLILWTNAHARADEDYCRILHLLNNSMRNGSAVADYGRRLGKSSLKSDQDYAKLIAESDWLGWHPPDHGNFDTHQIQFMMHREDVTLFLKKHGLTDLQFWGPRIEATITLQQLKDFGPQLAQLPHLFYKLHIAPSEGGPEIGPLLRDPALRPFFQRLRSLDLSGIPVTDADVDSIIAPLRFENLQNVDFGNSNILPNTRQRLDAILNRHRERERVFDANRI